MDSWRVIRQLVSIGIILFLAIVGVMLCMLLIGGSKLMSVQSGSMQPSIRRGDLISVTNTPTRDLRVGDVVTYKNQPSGEMITHRVVALTGDMSGRIVTKGDANAQADKSIMPAQIVGRVDRKIPLIGYAIDFIKHPIGLIAVVYLPALVIVIHEVKQLTWHYRKNQIYSLGSR